MTFFTNHILFTCIIFIDKYFALRSYFTKDPGSELGDFAVHTGPALHAAGWRAEGYYTYNGPPAGSIDHSLDGHQRTARVASARVFAALATRADLPGAQPDARDTVGPVTFFLSRQRQR